MRWSRREGPWGSHHEEASALKWDTSVGSTVPVGVVDGEGLWLREGVLERHRDDAGTVRCAMFRGIGVVEDRGMHCRIERAAIAGL
jgi:hypothetical protein